MTDHDSVSEMQKIMDAMNAESGLDIGMDSLSESIETSRVPSTASGSEIQAMRMILESFYGSDKPMDPELKLALQTEKTDQGARIGSWEIIVKEGMPRRYDVVHAMTREPIGKDLMVYEAAFGIVRHLNEGVPINDPRIADLLKLESDYSHSVIDAKVFKEREKTARLKGDHVRADVMEDRLSDAERKAEDAHDRILRLAGLRF